MSAVEAPTHPAARAIEEVLSELESEGIKASRDPGAFYPQPIGTLVGLPTLARRGAASRTFELPVLVISGDPLNSTLAVDRLYSLADHISLVLSVAAYGPSSWRSSVNAEPLPALELTVTVTVTEEVP